MAPLLANRISPSSKRYSPPIFQVKDSFDFSLNIPSSEKSVMRIYLGNSGSYATPDSLAPYFNFSFSRCLSGITSQCSGISPIQSTPESFIGTLGSRPRVTAFWIRICLRSLRSSICFSLMAMASSIFAVFSSRNLTMAICNFFGISKTGKR